jgi:small GTP-binding protein
MASHISIKILVVGDENVGKTTIINYFTLVPIKAVSTVGIDFQTRIVALSSDNDNIKKCIYDQEGQRQGQHEKCNEKNKNNKMNKKNSQNNISESETMLLSTMKVGDVVRPNEYDYVKCCFWDTSGSPNYKCLAQTYYTGIAAVIVVFDLSNQSSYNSLNSFIRRVIQKNTCSHSHPILVLGNKLDQRSIHFTKKQVFEAMCFDFPHENIRYEEVSCLDKMNTLENGCTDCAKSSDIHIVINSFIQSLYDSVVKPHYYNPQAIAAINCRGISGSSRFFKKKVDSDSVSSKRWSWKGNYTHYIRNNKDTNSKTGTSGETSSNNDYIQMPNLKSPRECCNEQGIERVSSCTSTCSIM